MKSYSKFLSILLLLLFLAPQVCFSDVILKELSGNAVSLSELSKDQKVQFVFWNPECGECITKLIDNDTESQALVFGVITPLEGSYDSDLAAKIVSENDIKMVQFEDLDGAFANRYFVEELPAVLDFKDNQLVKSEY